MKDSGSARNDWFMGIVKRIFLSDDGCVWKVEICVVKDGVCFIYVRLILEFVMFLEV